MSTEERAVKVTGRRESAAGRSSIFVLIERGVGAVDTWLNYIGVSFIILLMLMVVAQVFSRYVLRSPIRGYIDAMEMMMVVLVFLCLAYCQGHGGHIRVELFMDRVLKGGRRYHIVEFVYLLLALVAFALIAMYNISETLNAYAYGDVTITVYWPTWPARMLLAIGSVFLCVRFIVQMIQNLAWAVAGVRRPELLGAEREA